MSAAPAAIQRKSTARTGAAPRIRALKERYPEMSKAAIARKVGCGINNVDYVLKRYLGDTSGEDLRRYQENQADIFDSIANRLLLSITPEKVEKSKLVEAITGAAILIDKARLVRGQATSINMTAVVDLIEVMRAETGKVIDAARPDNRGDAV